MSLGHYVVALDYALAATRRIIHALTRYRVLVGTKRISSFHLVGRLSALPADHQL